MYCLDTGIDKALPLYLAYTVHICLLPLYFNNFTLHQNGFKFSYPFISNGINFILDGVGLYRHKMKAMMKPPVVMNQEPMFS
jgi:hypothetical protein